MIKTKQARSGRQASNWFINEIYSSTITIPSTPGGTLAKIVEENIRDKIVNKGRTKVIEKTGIAITSGLRKENPYRSHGCPYEDQCPVDPKVNCSTTNVTYQLTCNQCEAEQQTETRHMYIGCTGTSMHARGMDHLAKVNSDKTTKLKNSMAKHMALQHGGQNVGFTAKLLSKHNSCLVKFIDEALRIEKGNEEFGLANSKSEWG